LKIGIIGVGWFGRPLALELLALGHEVWGTTRDSAKRAELESLGIKVGALEEMLSKDVVIYGLPPSAGEFRYHTKAWVIFISSTSGSQVSDENWIKENIGDWSILRFGGLIGGGRHPGKSMQGKTGLKGRRWPVNLLHQADAVGFTLAVLENRIRHELINVVSDEHRSREEFYGSFASFDATDESSREAISNSRAKEIYVFTWPGREL
jgi:nucleoside-diphosphate-sugar epimerase